MTRNANTKIEFYSLTECGVRKLETEKKSFVLLDRRVETSGDPLGEIDQFRDKFSADWSFGWLAVTARESFLAIIY